MYLEGGGRVEGGFTGSLAGVAGVAGVLEATSGLEPALGTGLDRATESRHATTWKRAGVD